MVPDHPDVRSDARTSVALIAGPYPATPLAMRLELSADPGPAYAARAASSSSGTASEPSTRSGVKR